MTQTDASTVHTEPTERRPPGPWVWTLSGVLLTVAALAFGTGALLRWMPCFEGGFGTDACVWLQDDSSGPWSDAARSPVLTVATGLVGLAYVLAGLAFVVLPFVTRWARWLGLLAVLPAIWSLVEGSAMLIQSISGRTVPWSMLPGFVAVGVFGSVGLLVLPVVALLARASWRVAVLSIGLLFSGFLGMIADFFFWMNFYGSHDDPPGSGFLSAAVMLLAGVLLIASRHRPWIEPAEFQLATPLPIEPRTL